MAGYVAPVPKLFGGLAEGQGLLFCCLGCTRVTAVDRDEALERWGKEGKVEDVARRHRCRNCSRLGASVEMVRGRVFTKTREGDRVHAARSPVDRLAAEIATLRPRGHVT